MREQDSGNIVFYHSVSVLLLTASVFYSFLSHYQVAPQLHGKCYIQNKSPAMEHGHKFCSLKSAALQCSLCCQCFTMSRYYPHSPGFHRSSGLGFLASDSPERVKSPAHWVRVWPQAPAPRTRDQSRSRVCLICWQQKYRRHVGVQCHIPGPRQLQVRRSRWATIAWETARNI